MKPLYIILSITIAVAVANCRKSDPPPDPFLEYTLDNTKHSFAFPADSVLVDIPDIPKLTTILVKRRTGAEDMIILQFVGNSIGKPEVKYLHVWLNNFEYHHASITDLTVTEYGGRGEYIAGYFTSTVLNTTTLVSYPVTCNFRVKRQ